MNRPPASRTVRPGFVWAMAWRETRGSIRQFLFFLVCIMLGVGSLVGVSGFSASLEQTIRKEARALMAGDVQVRTNRPLSQEGMERIAELQDRGIRTTVLSGMIAMASDPETRSTQLVELKAVEEGYPFYGTLETNPAEAVETLPDGRTALAEEGLLIRLGLSVGDRIVLGQARFTITGVIEKEPDRVAGAFSLGPRVMISRKGLAQTELVQTGSRVRYRYLLKLPVHLTPAAIAEELKTTLANEGAQISSYDEAQPRLRRFLNNLTTYLGLVGLISLLVGGIGVANSVQAFIKGKMDTLAILKCLGAPSKTILHVYLLLTLLLGGLGSFAGVVLGIGVQFLLPSFLSGFLPADLPISLSVLPMVRGMAMGLLTTLLFALWSLLGIRRVPPALVFRREMAEDRLAVGGHRPWLTGVVIIAGLAVLALWQIGSFSIGGTFIGVLAASLLLLRLAAWAGIRLLKSLPRPRSLAWRQGLTNLYRPGSQAIAAVLSVGVGVTVILAIHLIETSLLRQIKENLPADAPSFFFIDIQTDQKAPFEHLLAERQQETELTPIVRARLHAVENRRVDEMNLEGRSDSWYFRREYVVTFKEQLPRGNTVKQGAWWTPVVYRDRALISVEKDVARHLGVGVDSTVTFDIQGLLVTATVASIREVNWGNMSTNFFVIFSPGALEDAPITYIATTRTMQGKDHALQQAVISAFPNVTAINIRHVLDAIRSVLERIASVIRFMAGFTIMAGLIVLSGAIATSRYRRIRESVILKTLGATRAVIARTFAVEYVMLGAVAGTIGVLMASLLAFILLRFFLDVPWQLQPVALVVSLLVAICLTVFTGFLTTFRILGQKPLAVLRYE